MSIEALVFDMDGLIFDSERVVQRSWNYAGEQLGIPRIGDHIYNTIGFNVVRREAYFRKAIRADFPMEEFNTLTRARFHEIADTEGIAVKTGARELILYAKEHGYKVALATSSRKEHSAGMLQKAGLYEYFDGLVFGDMVTKGKPNPEIYLTACASVQADPLHSIALEDSPAGIQAAHAAGMYPIMVPDLVQPSKETKELLYRKCDTLLEVIDILEKGVE